MLAGVTSTRHLAFTALAALCAGGAAAQRSGAEADDAWREDPYTTAEPDGLARAGYVALGRLQFAGAQETPQIEHILGEDVKMLWVETAHFQIGCSLPPYLIQRTEWDEKAKIQAELARLKKKLPKIDAKATRLDRWTRLHLFAQRAEDLYAQFAQRLRVDDSSFPADRAAAELPGAMGQGPYLGQPAKFSVLLVQKASTFGTYWRTYVGGEADSPRRWNFVATGSLFYGGAIEHSQDIHRSDTATHCHLVYNLVHNLTDGFGFYLYQLPAWWSEGLAHCYVRDVEPRFALTSDPRTYEIDPDRAWTWATRVYKRVKFDHFPPAAELLRWYEPMQLSFADHMMAWSRVEYLLTLGDEGFSKYMHLMKAPMPRTGPVPNHDEILAQQERALREAWDLDAPTFDERWRKHVLAHYRNRKD